VASKQLFSLAVLIVLAISWAQNAAADSRGFEAEEEMCHDSTCFPPYADVHGKQLPLRSSGNKDWWIFSLYDAAIYVDENIPPNQYLEAVPKKIILRYRRSISKEDFIEAAEYNLARNPDNDLGTLRERIDQIHSLYQDVEKGDEYALVYSPEKGTDLLLNGEYVGSIPGDDFARAYFGIWLSEYVVCRKLRWQLLGARYSWRYRA